VPAGVGFAGFAGKGVCQFDVIVPEVAGGDRAPEAAPPSPSNFHEIDRTKPTISFVFNADWQPAQPAAAACRLGIPHPIADPGLDTGPAHSL
jgi:hypothetical protein